MIQANLITSFEQFHIFHADISDYKTTPPLCTHTVTRRNVAFLDPGGRYLVHSNASSLNIYDLGEVDSPRYSGFPPIDSTTLEDTGGQHSEIGVVQRDDSTLRVVATNVGDHNVR